MAGSLLEPSTQSFLTIKGRSASLSQVKQVRSVKPSVNACGRRHGASRFVFALKGIEPALEFRLPRRHPNQCKISGLLTS
jgi:hypothetical protein